MTQPRQGRGRREPREGPAGRGQGQRRPGAPPTCSEHGVPSSRGGGDVCTAPEIGARAQRGGVCAALCHGAEETPRMNASQAALNKLSGFSRTSEEQGKSQAGSSGAQSQGTACSHQHLSTFQTQPRIPSPLPHQRQDLPRATWKATEQGHKKTPRGTQILAPGTLLHASSTTQAPWGGGMEGNPSKTRPRLDDARSPTAQRVTATPGSCQRCHQQPRLQARVSPRRQRLPQHRASSAKQPWQWIRTRRERHRIPQHPEPSR